MVDLKNLIPISHMRGEDPEETLELKAMHRRARDYLLAHDWCHALSDEYMGFGVGGVVAVFLFRAKLKTGAEEWLWVVEGDLPSAYLVTDHARTAAAALETYTTLMDDWVKAVRSGVGLEDAFPVDAPADEEHALLLESRIKLLTGDVIPAARART